MRLVSEQGCSLCPAWFPKQEHRYCEAVWFLVLFSHALLEYKPGACVWPGKAPECPSTDSQEHTCLSIASHPTPGFPWLFATLTSIRSQKSLLRW